MNVTLNERDRIVEVAERVHFERYPDWTVDELLLHPREAIKLCREVRVSPLVAFPSDSQILRAYLNARKQGRLRDRPASRAAHRPRASKPRPRRKT